MAQEKANRVCQGLLLPDVRCGPRGFRGPLKAIKNTRLWKLEKDDNNAEQEYKSVVVVDWELEYGFILDAELNHLISLCRRSCACNGGIRAYERGGRREGRKEELTPT